jgi:CMP-2-keto-3-deoxyoctulosonic acid synthetase
MSSWWTEGTELHKQKYILYNLESSDDKFCLRVKDVILNVQTDVPLILNAQTDVPLVLNAQTDVPLILNVQTDVPLISVNTVFVGI